MQGHKDHWGECEKEMQKYIAATFANKKLMYYRAVKKIKEMEEKLKKSEIQLVG